LDEHPFIYSHAKVTYTNDRGGYRVDEVGLSHRLAAGGTPN
jgi:hypothetical protein